MYIIEREKTYKFHMLDLKDNEKTYFEELEDLLEFLRKGQGHFWSFLLDKEDTYNNRYLDDANLTGYDRKTLSRYNTQTKSIEYYSELKRYMFYNAKDEIIDVTIYANNVKKRAERYFEEHKWDHKPKYIYRHGPVPGTNAHYRGHYCRHIQTTREKRYACDPEHKPYIRGKRNFTNIPDLYDDHFVEIRRDWKAKTKQRKQWARHLEYSKVPDKYLLSDFFDYDEDSLENDD